MPLDKTTIMLKKYRFSPWFNALICLALALCLLTFSYIPNLVSQAAIKKPISSTITERRGVWLTNVASAVLFTPGSINRAIKQLGQLNFNTVYPVVWNRGNTFYPSAFAKQMTGTTQEPLLNFMSGGTDILSVIVRESHLYGLEVIPWFEYGLMVPKNASLAQLYPDWLTQSQPGNSKILVEKIDQDVPKNKDKLGNLITQWLGSNHQKRVSELVWLNPLHPEVQQFIKGLMLEVAMNYDIDGVQLDDHFGLPVDLGYDPLTIKLYQQEHLGKTPPKDPHNPEWMRWRAAKLSAFMADLVKTLKTVKPNLKIFLSPNSYEFSYQNYLQDWKNWVKRGLIDELVLQVYRLDSQGFQEELQKPAVQFARQKIPVSIGILSGTLNRPVPIQTIEKQVKIVRDRGFNGVCFFYWESLWSYLSPDSPYKRRQVFSHLFSPSKPI